MTEGKGSGATMSFSVQEPRFDKDTYWGRVASISAGTQFKNAFMTKGQISEMQSYLQSHKEKEAAQFTKTGSYKLEVTKEEKDKLCLADDVVQAAVHPDTNLPLPWIMRISSFMPMNIPLNIGFILAPPTIVNTITVHVANQSYNAIMNFGNANAKSPQTKEDIAKSYAMAVAASVGVSLLIRQVNAKRSAAAFGSRLIMLNAITSTVACMCGGFANNWFMRQVEMEKGIELCDPDTNEPIGKSRKCAKAAVLQTASSRIFLAMPVALPAFALVAIEKMGMMPKSPMLAIPLQIALICGQLTFAVPMSMGAFPQIATIKAADLEPEFQGLRSKVKGELITEFKYNKGL